MSGGSGKGDSGAEDRAAADAARKASATADINRLFGVDTTKGVAPNRQDFVHTGASIGGTPVLQHFDQPGYDQALAAYNTRSGENDANAAARAKLYGDTRSASYDFNKNKLDTDRDTSERQLRFALARSGLFGGSTDVDQHALQQRAYDQGILDIGNQADAGVADLRSADENSRLGLISQVNAGVDAGSALSSGREQLSVNADRANAAARSAAINNLFQNIGLLTDNSARTAGVLNARNQYNAPGAFFPTRGSSGTIYQQG